MRLSGTYFERLLINVLPWTVFWCLTYYFLKGEFNIYVLLILTTALWTIDTLIIYFRFKKPKPLKANEKLWIGDESICLNDIQTITPVTDQRMKWSFKMIEISLTNGRTLMVIDKPQTFFEDLMKRPPKH